jgi:hypothetical protein
VVTVHQPFCAPPDDPPFPVQNGGKGYTIPVENTRMLADALRAPGNDLRFDLLAVAG